MLKLAVHMVTIGLEENFLYFLSEEEKRERKMATL
jgi:hypothetical protein